MFPCILAAQEDKFIDCRERSCEVEDIVRALQPPVQTPQSPTIQYRGIPTTTTLPAAAIPAAALPRTALALNIGGNAVHLLLLAAIALLVYELLIPEQA